MIEQYQTYDRSSKCKSKVTPGKVYVNLVEDYSSATNKHPV